MWRAYARREDLFGISLQSQHLVATTGADTLAVFPHEKNEIPCASFISIRSLLILSQTCDSFISIRSLLIPCASFICIRSLLTLSQTRSPYAPPHRTDPPAPPKHQVDNSNEPYLYKVSGSWGCAPAPPPRHARLFRRFDFGSPTHSLDLSPITFPLAAPPTAAPALMPGAAAAAASRRTRACGRSSWRGSAGWRRPATSLTTSFSEGPP